MAQPFTDLIQALPNLRFAYPLDAGGVADAGPYGLTLTPSGPPGTTTPGPVLDDDATSFNGTTQSMQRAHHFGFNFGLLDFTVGAFIKPTDTSAGTRMFLCHDGDGGGGAWELWQSGVDLNSRIEGTPITAAVLDTSWQFVAVVMDRDGNGRMWRNGAWAAAGTSIAAHSATNIDVSATLWIGRRETTGYWTGSMAWAFGCAAALTDVQLLALYEARDDAAGGPPAAGAAVRSLSALAGLRGLAR